MGITLSTFAATDINYVNKHNNNNKMAAGAVGLAQEAYLKKSEKDQPYGYAGLNAEGRVENVNTVAAEFFEMTIRRNQYNGYVGLVDGAIPAQYMPITYSRPVPGSSPTVYIPMFSPTQVFELLSHKDAGNGYAGLYDGAVVKGTAIAPASQYNQDLRRGVLWAWAFDDTNPWTYGDMGITRIDATTGHISDEWLWNPPVTRFEQTIQNVAGRGAPNGYALLDVDGYVDLSQVNIPELADALGL